MCLLTLEKKNDRPFNVIHLKKIYHTIFSHFMSHFVCFKELTKKIISTIGQCMEVKKCNSQIRQENLLSRQIYANIQLFKMNGLVI